MNILDLDSDFPVGHIGPRLDSGPLPAVFYFALSIQESLELDPYNQPTRYLEDENVHIFSFNLPFHGPNLNPVDAIGKWANEYQLGNDLLDPFIDRVAEIIDDLISRRVIIPEKIGLIGLSRGGLIASLVAAKKPSIAALVAFAPMTDLGKAKEFEGIKQEEIVEKYNLLHLVDTLYSIPVRIYIGNRDVRVGTERCFHLVQSLAETAYQKGLRSPPVELVISPSIGNMGHGTSKEIFEAGALWIGKKLGIK